MAHVQKSEKDMKEDKGKLKEVAEEPKMNIDEIAEAPTIEGQEKKKEEKITDARTLDKEKVDDKKTTGEDKIIGTDEDNKKDTKTDEKKPEPKKPQPKVKKEEVFVNSQNLHISKKYACAICKFIKGKSIEKARSELEEVVAKRKAIPMKGEIPHRKGKIMSGRFPVNAAKAFIILLKSLQGNANNHEVEEPIIIEAVANIGDRPRGRFGRWQRKRTHVKIIARSKKERKGKNKSKRKFVKKGGKK